jgi:hypothetical protein
MDIITRRSFLGSLALGSVYPNVGQTAALQLHASEGEAHPSEIHWSITKQNFVAKLDRVDFWSKPLCATRYAEQLSATVGLGALFDDETGELPAKAGLLPADLMSLTKKDPFLHERFSIQRGTGIKTLTELLRAEVGARRFRTSALIALDSRWSTQPGPDWADILPAFRSCYDRLIGHYHITQRGFHHWKTSLTECAPDASRFERFFTNAASQCDVVVFTSQSLLENDVHLSARASTESLVGELMQRFAQVLCDEKLVQQIVPISKRSGKGTNQPHMLALSSAGASSQFPTIQASDLLRQRELVFSSFGKPISSPRIIGFGLNEACAKSIHDQISNTNMIYLSTNAIADGQADPSGAEWLKFVTLWPFDPDSGPWP